MSDPISTETSEEMVDDRESIIVLKKACPKCGLFNPFDDNLKIYKCKDDPECTAKRKVLKKGKEPEVMKKLFMEVLASDQSESSSFSGLDFDMVREAFRDIVAEKDAVGPADEGETE